MSNPQRVFQVFMALALLTAYGAKGHGHEPKGVGDGNSGARKARD